MTNMSPDIHKMIVMCNSHDDRIMTIEMMMIQGPDQQDLCTADLYRRDQSHAEAGKVKMITHPQDHHMDMIT